jgi:hypothetical protein
MLTLENAIKGFMEKLTRSVRDGTFKSMKRLLQEGPPGRQKDPKLVEMQNWFLNLNEDDRRFVLEIAQETIDRTIFNFLVLLDNKVPGYPITGEVSDFALSIQTYKRNEDLFDYRPKDTVRINRSYTGGDLHDNFTIYILESTECEFR